MRWRRGRTSGAARYIFLASATSIVALPFVACIRVTSEACQTPISISQIVSPPQWASVFAVTLTALSVSSAVIQLNAFIDAPVSPIVVSLLGAAVGAGARDVGNVSGWVHLTGIAALGGGQLVYFLLILPYVIQTSAWPVSFVAWLMLLAVSGAVVLVYALGGLPAPAQSAVFYSELAAFAAQFALVEFLVGVRDANSRNPHPDVEMDK